MNTTKIPSNLIFRCNDCGPQTISWEWQCPNDTKITCPNCGKGMGVTVRKAREILHEEGFRAVRRILRGR